MNTTKLLFSSIVFTILLSACETKKTSTTPNESLTTVHTETEIQQIEKAHHKAHFLSKEAIKFDIIIEFGGNQILDGKMTLATNSSKSMIEMKDGTKIIAIENKVYHSSEMKASPMIRFHAYTWPYFFLFPYKLSDEGTVWSEFGNEKLNENPYNIQKLTFKNNTGDTPDDWYYAYSNPENHLLNLASYIVTYGSSKEKAEKDPHAIQYNNFTKIEGIPFATDWIFWGWNRTDGLSNKLGKATLNNIHFVENVDFSFPDTFVEK